MAISITRKLGMRAGLLSSASIALAFGLALPSTANAQSTSDQPATPTRATPSAEPAADASDIIVTGTRVVRDGYKAPTPTSVIGAEEIAKKAPANLADFVNELPSLAASNTPRANVGFVSPGLVGINALNLRSLGENRTLVLLDGQRVGASTLTGLVDINQFPQALVKRVDVVTGGASASWGSDAVAGVVNFVLDKDFTGLKGQVQGGVTTYGDDRSFNVQLTAGARFADDRGHILLSGEIAHNDGITGIGKRTWYNGAKIITNPAYNAVTNNTVPQLLSLPNVGYVSAPGGLITSGPLRGTYFGASGTAAPFNFGNLTSGINIQGGDWALSDIGTSGDLDPEQSRQNIFGRVSYDLTDHIQIFAQGSYSRATANNGAINYLGFGRTIQPDNAYIPASIKSSVTGPFSLSTTAQDLGVITASTRRSSWRAVIGAKGDFEALGSQWTWSAYGQKSVSRSYASTYIPINARVTAAIDAVRNANGVIVCRSTLTNPNDGCVPFNVFGTGVNSPSARAYILGTAWGANRLTQDVVAGTLNGTPFSTWAGPVSIATGIEHRREGVSGSNDPLSTTNSYFAGNYHASFGSYHVTEGFIEAVVPLAKDVPFAKSLDLNAAVRATDYSTSGYVTTWKVGLTYSPLEDITFRFTRSRDIRAPNLSELFQAGQTSTNIVVDPFRNNASTTAFQITSGNLNLKPEKADTLGLGVVLQPRFLPGFAASIDFWDIHINDAITTTNAQQEINQCNQGNTIFCSQIVRDPSGPLINGFGPITTVGVVPVNVAKQIARGIDFEASYRRPVLQGNLSLRLLVTRNLKKYSNDGITAATDVVGTNGFGTNQKNSLPKWRYIATVGYDRDPFGFSLTARGFSAGVQNTSYIECTTGCPVSTAANMTINDNRLPGAIYFDTNVSFKLSHGIETFLAVDNLLNKDPAQVAYGPGLSVAPISVNPVLYDVLGRTFRLGVRFKM